MDVTWSQLKTAGAAFDKREQPQMLGATLEKEQGFDFVGVATQGLVMVCDFLGHPQRLGAHWKTTPQEAGEFAQAIDNVMPEDFNVGKWGALFIAGGVFVAPRVAITMMNKNKPQQPAQQQQAPAAQQQITRQPVEPAKQTAPAIPESSRGN